MKRNCVAALIAIAPCIVWGQLIANPKTIPHTGNPPVVFLNGFETNCSGATFQGTFGIADQFLQNIGRPSIFFNNCTVSGSTIEKLGAAFGAFISGLTYDDGQPVAQVDVVAYSMGGLILRSYLSGKQEAQGVFNPPASVPIGKVVFIATPHFGTPVAGLAFGSNTEADELSSGSHFLMDLNTWNQSRDDLRGLDVIALAGTGGTGLAVSPGFDDGLVALSSASLRFYMPGRTRVLPLCHVSTPGLLTLTGFCPPNAKGIARMNAATDDNARIVVSFLTGTSDWQTIGTPVEQNSSLRNGSGVLVRARTADDLRMDPSSITAGSKKLNMSNPEIGFTDLVTAGTISVAVSAGSGSFSQNVGVPPGGARAIIAKPGPVVNAVIPAAAVVLPVVVAPRMIVAIYGVGMEGAQVTFNTQPLTSLYVSDAQINAVMPANAAPGLGKLTVRNASGSQTVNLYVEPFYPAVFTLTNNAAAAVNADTRLVVSETDPLHAGQYLELFLTGLGVTQDRDGLEYATVQPSVTVAGVDCPVTYAGAAPGFIGLDQINCRVPAGISPQSAAPVVVRTGARSSPATTVSVD